MYRSLLRDARFPAAPRTVEGGCRLRTLGHSEAAAVMRLAPDVPYVVARAGDVIALKPNVLSVRHWDRLMGGALYAASPRIDGARLLRRSFAADVLECPKCHGRLPDVARTGGPVTSASLHEVLNSVRIASQMQDGHDEHGACCLAVVDAVRAETVARMSGRITTAAARGIASMSVTVRWTAAKNKAPSPGCWPS